MMTRSRSDKRNVDGILLLDKAIGPSSNAVLQSVKTLFQAKKAGHTGSLDPLATGMLPICFGRATRFCQYLLAADKSYLVGFKLGIATTTGDKEGEVIATKQAPSLSRADLEQYIKPFCGEIWQVPSMYSALKHKGRPLYEYARKGIEIKREPRQLTINEFSVLDIDNDLVFCKVTCSKGTYIRSLVTDLGEAIGCGAHVVELRRLTVGGFKKQQMVCLDQLQSACDKDGLAALNDFVLPVSQAVNHFSQYEIMPAQLQCLAQGKTIMMPNTTNAGFIALYSEKTQFLGVGEVLADGCTLKAKQWFRPVL